MAIRSQITTTNWSEIEENNFGATFDDIFHVIMALRISMPNFFDYENLKNGSSMLNAIFQCLNVALVFSPTDKSSTKLIRAENVHRYSKPFIKS